jgi:hypothetical protein
LAERPAIADELIIPPARSAPNALRTMAIGLVFLLLMSVGAGAAACVFRDRVHRIVAQWHAPAARR